MDTKFLSRNEAEAITENFKNGVSLPPYIRNKKLALISIVSPIAPDEVGVINEEDHKPKLDAFWHKVLYLRFNDIDPTHCSDKWVTKYTPFNDDHIKQINEFLSSVDNDVDGVWVHCEAGISRSAAVAKYIDMKYDCGIFPDTYKLYNKFVFGKLRQAYFNDRYLQSFPE